jgi:hypothetical protein
MKDEQKKTEDGRVYRIVEDGVDVVIRIEEHEPAKTLREELEGVPTDKLDVALAYLQGLAKGAEIKRKLEAKENEQ